MTWPYAAPGPLILDALAPPHSGGAVYLLQSPVRIRAGRAKPGFLGLPVHSARSHCLPRPLSLLLLQSRHFTFVARKQDLLQEDTGHNLNPSSDGRLLPFTATPHSTDHDRKHRTSFHGSYRHWRVNMLSFLHFAERHSQRRTHTGTVRAVCFGTFLLSLSSALASGC